VKEHYGIKIHHDAKFYHKINLKFKTNMKAAVTYPEWPYNPHLSQYIELALTLSTPCEKKIRSDRYKRFRWIVKILYQQLFYL
jgi:hypothetical protein